MAEKKKVKKDEFLEKVAKTLSLISSESRRLRIENAKLLEKIQHQLECNAFSVDKCKRQIESFEDSLLHIMHNIKKNQFLYAHYPDEWVKDYRSLKKGLKFENEFMDKKGALNA